MSARAAIVQGAAAALTAASGGAYFGGKNFTVVRKYLPSQTAAFLHLATTGFVLTLPPIGPEEREQITRGLIEKKFSFDIGVQIAISAACKPATDDANPELDGYMGFTELVAHFFEPDPKATPPQTGIIASTPPAGWVSSVVKPAYDPEHLRQFRVFTSRVVLTVRYF